MPPSSRSLRTMVTFAASCLLPLLLRAAPPVDSVVVFNEIQYHPADPGEASEFIELHNQMGVNIDLSGWRIAGGVDFRIPDGTVIPGNGFLVVARTPSGIPGVLGPWTGALANSGETLRLRDRNDRLMDEISYGDSGDWPVAADGSGATLSKMDPDASSPAAGNWTFSKASGGTPNGDNFPPPPPVSTVRVINLRDSWRIDNSGTVPPAGWTLPGFNAAAWPQGSGLVDFGGTTVYDAPDPNAPEPGGNQEITSVTVFSKSSEATTSGLRRAAVNCVNESGLTNGMHGILPDDTMWLTNGDNLAPADPLPTEVTFAFPAAHTITKLHVWNYNENRSSNQSSRGAKDVEILTASDPGGPFVSAGTFVFRQASGTASEAGEDIALTASGVRYVKLIISSNWGASGSFTGLSEVKFYSDEPPPPAAPPVHRETIAAFAATGTQADGSLAAPGSTDVHYINTATGSGVKVQTGHPAWLGPDGLSQWTGTTASGQDNAPPGELTWRLSVDLTNWRKDSALVKLHAAADNSLDAVKINGVTLPGVYGSGFSAWLGPFTVSNASLQAGLNTIDLVWSNGAGSDNPAGFRARWEATAEPDLTGTTLASNPTTTRFRKHFTYTGIPGASYQMHLEHVLDDGAVFYLNGTELKRVNLPAGPLTSATPALTNVLYPQFSGRLEVPAGALLQGDNVVAVELHQASDGMADALFGMSLDVSATPPTPGAVPALTFSEAAAATVGAGAFFVELSNGSGSSVDLTGWSLRSSTGAVSALSGSLTPGARIALTESLLTFRPLDGDRLFLIAPGGSVADGIAVKNRPQARDSAGAWAVPSIASPGESNTFAISDSIVINEILYAHIPVYLPTGTISDPEEWVEIFNRGGSSVDLSGWRLRGGADFDFPPGTSLAAGGYLVVARNSGALKTKFPAATIVGDWTGSLSNQGDTVRIEDANGNTVDEVRYLTGGNWDGRADGGGSSLELRHPAMDNSLPGSWEASDETGKAQWQTFTYSGLATPPGGSNDPTNYNELVLGLLSEGVFLLDDVSVKDNSASNVELIQDGGFSAGTAASWRLLGNHGSHGRSGVVSDGGNSVLKVTATGPTEHMHNHCETTLKNGASLVAINASHNYRVSFKAKWQSGSPRLNSRLYFNRLNRQNLLAVPMANGTPGAPNSRLLSQPAPGLSNLANTPVLPAASQPVTVRVRAAAAVTPSAVTIFWRKDPDGSWASQPMSPASDQFYESTLPGQAAGSLVQFYVKAETAAGGTAFLPAAGADSRAMIRWSDGVAPPGPGHGFRILLPQADTDFLHLITNVMSNDYLPCTVVYRESEVFYDAGVRLKSSQRGRYGDARLGFAIQFDPEHLFRGVHAGVNMDRSAYGQGSTGSGFGQVDIMNQQFASRAGGIPAMYNDMVYLIAPRIAHTGSAQMTMAEFNDVYLDSQWEKGADTPTFKLDLIYFPTTTAGGSKEGLKNAQPDDVKGVNIGQLTGAGKNPELAKEDFRWNFIIGNARSSDDFTSLMAFNHAFARLAAGDASEIDAAIDVDQWLRASASMALINSNDSYSTGGLPHNLKLYVRPDDGRVLYLPWDADFFQLGATTAVAGNADLVRILNANAGWRRAFYGHLHDIISTSYNVNYLTPWVTHLSRYSTAGDNWNDFLTYVQQRSAFVLSDCNAKYPRVNFNITTNGGQNFSSGQSLVTLDGSGWIDVNKIRLAGSAEPLTVTWLSGSTWRVTLPVRTGVNAFVIEALDYQGAVTGTDTITITGTGSVVAAGAGNVVVSEFNYHPPDPTAAEMSAGFSDADDFEYIELSNISAVTVDLSGCHFTTGLSYSFASGITLPPGGKVVIPRRTAAFNLRWPGVPAVAEYYEATGNVLSNSGETIALTDASGVDIKRFTYSDNLPWPDSADGNGPSLVLMAPLANPEHGNPLNWRTSATPGGTPGSSDSRPVPVNPLSDSDGDGVSDLLAWAAGGRPVIQVDPGSISVVRDSLTDALWSLESSESLGVWTPLVPLAITRTILTGSKEEIRYRLPESTPSRTFYRWRVALP